MHSLHKLHLSPVTGNTPLCCNHYTVLHSNYCTHGVSSSIPQHLPLPLIHRFNHVATQLQGILLRHFLLIYAAAHKRSLSAAPATPDNNSSIPPRPLRPLSTQRRLTGLWKLPPPYIADSPASCVAPRSKQLSLTSFLQPLQLICQHLEPPPLHCDSPPQHHVCRRLSVDVAALLRASQLPLKHAAPSPSASRAAHMYRMQRLTLETIPSIMIPTSPRLQASCMQMCASV